MKEKIDIYSKELFEYIKSHKVFSLIFFLVIFFTSLFISFPKSTETEKTDLNQSPAVSIAQRDIVLPTTPQASETGYEDEPPLNQLNGFLKEEQLAGGLTKYTYTSTNPKRPNIIIASGDGEDDAVFQRKVPPAAIPFGSIALYKEAYGEPEKTVLGSAFYGQEANIYIYESIGLVFIANPRTSQVYEEHYFTPMSSAEYFKKYGDYL